MIQDPSTRATERSGELDWLLDDLVLRVREVRHAVVLSNDGLAVGASSDLKREDAEHLAAVASGFHSLAKGTGRHFGAAWRTSDHGGNGRRLPLRGRSFYDGSRLAVLTSVTADIGLVAYEMARLVKRVGEHLYTPTRSGARPPAAG